HLLKKHFSNSPEVTSAKKKHVVSIICECIDNFGGEDDENHNYSLVTTIETLLAFQVSYHRIAWSTNIISCCIGVWVWSYLCKSGWRKLSGFFGSGRYCSGNSFYCSIFRNRIDLGPAVWLFERNVSCSSLQI